MLVDEDQHLPLFSSLEKREFLIFVSGLEFGSGIERRLTERFSKWVLGEYGTKNDKLLSSRISRIIMGGGNIGEENQINDVIKGSFRTQEINERVYSNINSSLEYFESFVKQLSDSLSIDVMPGENDLSGSFLPQQPLNPALFPSLIDSSNIVFSTNPHKFSINNYDFLGTSGQNIQDIWWFRSMEDMREVDVLYQTLEMRHIAPTCPDTLRSYPFESEDPLIIKEGVNVYFSCNAKEYGSIWEKNQLSVFTVPSFSKTKSFILLDLETLETYEYKFER